MHLLTIDDDLYGNQKTNKPAFTCPKKYPGFQHADKK